MGGDSGQSVTSGDNQCQSENEKTPATAGDPAVTGVLNHEGAGARTLDLRIKSPLLYRLSYALVW